jgi:hypothetical protein
MLWMGFFGGLGRCQWYRMFKCVTGVDGSVSGRTKQKSTPLERYIKEAARDDLGRLLERLATLHVADG